MDFQGSDTVDRSVGKARGRQTITSMERCSLECYHEKREEENIQRDHDQYHHDMDNAKHQRLDVHGSPAYHASFTWFVVSYPSNYRRRKAASLGLFTANQILYPLGDSHFVVMIMMA